MSPLRMRGLLALAFGALCTGAAAHDAPPHGLTDRAALPLALDGAKQHPVPTATDPLGRILARVMVNGRGPFRFMVDTGANHSALAASMLPRLGLALDKDKSMTVSGINGTMVTGSVHIDSLDAGALHLSDAQIPVLAGPLLADIDGILGIDGLKDRTITADFVHDRFFILGSLGGIPLGDVVVSGRLISQHLLEVDCEFGGVKAKAIIDTGSPRTLANRALLQALARRSGANASSLPTGVIDATEVSQVGVIEPVPTMQIGNATVSNLYLTFGDFRVFKLWGIDDRPAVLVGMDVLGSFAEMSIDYRRKELGVFPRSNMITFR